MSEEEERPLEKRSVAFGKPLHRTPPREPHVSVETQEHSKTKISRGDVAVAGRMEEEGDHTGPFKRPRRLTPEEIEEKRKKKLRERSKLEKIIKDNTFDKPTISIAKLLSMMNFSLAKFYLWRPLLFNALMIELVGFMMFIAFSGILSMVTMSLIATFMGFMIAFFLKFMIYSVWLFRKAGDKQSVK